MKAVLFALLGSGALAGCMIGDTSAPGPGPGSGSNPDNPDAAPSGGGNPDAPGQQATCTVGADLGTLGTMASATATQGNVSGSMGAKHTYKLVAPITGSPNDYVSLYLVDGAGTFAGGLVTAGTYTIGAADSNINTCGLCAIVLGDVDPTTKLATQAYLAVSGTVTIDSVGTGGGTLKAEITGAAYSAGDLTTGTAAAGACQTTVGTASLSSIVTVAGGGGNGGGGGTGPAGI